MSRWTRIWLSAWRGEPIAMMSPLPVDVARERLTAGRVSSLRAAYTFSGFGEYRIVGRVGTRGIRLEARKVGMRNSWRPVLRARLEPAGTGSRLVGRLGLDPVLKVFSVLWLGAAICAFLGTAVNAVVRTWNGDANGAVFVACLVPLGFLLFFVGLTALGMRFGRGQAAYLRSWLAERLQTADDGLSGYRGPAPRSR